jgi:hypothetical protein
MEQGFYNKYVVTKANGNPIDPEAEYFVLRIDNDPAAKLALAVYAANTPNKTLSKDLMDKIGNQAELTAITTQLADKCSKCVAEKDIYLASTVRGLGTVRKELAEAKDKLEASENALKYWEDIKEDNISLKATVIRLKAENKGLVEAVEKLPRYSITSEECITDVVEDPRGDYINYDELQAVLKHALPGKPGETGEVR